VSKSELITPRTLKGFRDYLPDAMVAREWLIDTAREVYRSFGFAPIDTPALEYEEILVGKGGAESDKQLYRFTDHGGREVALRFDLTVPFARFSAQNIGQLGTPFKRYAIGPVWRGENTQRGRYREFIQCDFDTIGTESVVADIETALVITQLMERLDVGGFSVRCNNRQVLNGMLERLELVDEQVAVLRALDKLAKIGADAVTEELMTVAGASAAQAREVLTLADVNGSRAQVLDELVPLVAGSETGEAGVARLAEIVGGVTAAGVAEERLLIDVSIARGLDYYTGAVFETFLDDAPAIGSVCSGGRYDDLASLYTKQRLPGIGASLGVDRLLAALEELGRLEGRGAARPVFVPRFGGSLSDQIALAAELRDAGFAVELYPEDRKLGAQLKYADRRGLPVAVIVGEDELAAGTCQLKDLRDGSTADVARGDALVDALRALMSRGGMIVP